MSTGTLTFNQNDGDYSRFCLTPIISAINLFSSSRQVKKAARDGTEEIWLEKTYFTTEETFPTVLRRSEVVGVEIVEISPIENALNEVEQKTKELSSLHQKYQALAKTAQQVSTNALAMSLNSAVDAPLNTGIASYRQTFFNPDYLARNPERAEMVEKLKIAIDEQVSNRGRYILQLQSNCLYRCASSTAVSNFTDTSALPNSSLSTKP